MFVTYHKIHLTTPFLTVWSMLILTLRCLFLGGADFSPYIGCSEGMFPAVPLLKGLAEASREENIRL